MDLRPGGADLSDPAALNHLKAKLGSAFNAGALLYAGADRPVWDRLTAVPLSGLWSP